MIPHLCLEFPEAVVYVPQLRKTCRCFIEGLGASPEDVNDIELLIGELATNAVRHAQGQGYQVDVEFFAERSTTVLTVIDRGHGFLPEAVAPQGTLRTDTLPSASGEGRFGGWGLSLIYSIADRVEILPTVPKGTTIRVEKALRSIYAASER
jgi:anti-sigma regulatory factor (Ser/Thr protein kinase)